MFGAPFKLENHHNYTDDEREFSRDVIKMWSSFAKTGYVVLLLIKISNRFYPVKRILEQDFGVLEKFDLFNFRNKCKSLTELNCLISSAAMYHKREKSSSGMGH